jgi:cell division protein FtsL
LAATPAERGLQARSEPARRVEPERSHLRLVQPSTTKKTGRRRLGLTMVILSFAGLCLGLVVLHALIAENQFKLDRLQDQASVAQVQYEKLRLEVAQLEAPARIVSVAEGRLHMVQPGSVTYLPAPATSSGAPEGARSARRGVSQASAGSLGTVAAPQGDANWPAIKPDVSSSP